MDDLTFTWVSIMTAAGGALGTLVGFNKLAEKRKEEKANVTSEVSRVADTNPERAMVVAHDFSRTVGYLGMHSLYGMVVYPFMPMYFLGNVLRNDFKRRFSTKFQSL